MELIPWVKKYHPNEPDNISGHKNILQIINNMIEQDNVMNMILVGTMGVGKSSIAKCISNKLYGNKSSIMTLKMNASDKRCIGDIRVKIQNFASTSFENNKKRFIILDEADSMTLDAQLALRKIMDQYTNKVNFCIICNYIRKIHFALKSRSIIFKVKPVHIDFMYNRLKYISTNENCNYSDEIIKEIVKISNGDMRKAINTLYMLSFHDNITIKDVYTYSICISPENKNMLFNILSSTKNILYKIEEFDKIIVNNGYNLVMILEILLEYILINKYYNLLPKISEIEARLNYDYTYELQLSGILSIFE